MFKTALQVVPTLIGILLIMFMILKAIPGDAVDVWPVNQAAQVRPAWR